MRRRTIALGLLIFLLWLPRAFALDALDSYVRKEMASRRIPGLALLVLRNHRIVRAANYGLSNVELKTPVTDSTSFEIASMTKQFTDAAVLLLAQDGKLGLDDHISKYFPDLPAAWEPITIRQLMTHTAGLRDDWDEDDAFFYSRTTTQEFFDALKAAPLKFAPGTGFSYGCGPFVLGLLIERVTGQLYARFMRERIFQPLGMSATDVNDPMSIVPDRAAGYVIRDGRLRNGVRISPAAEARGDVGIRTTARDLARWDAALDGDRLLSSASRALMFTPARLTNGDPVPYGFGWFLLAFRGHPEIGHTGGFRTGFSSVIARYPDDGLTVIVLTNLQGAHAYSLARGVASHYDADYRPISSMARQPDRHPERTAAVARALDALRGGRPSADLAPGAARAVLFLVPEIPEMLAGAPPPVFIGCREIPKPRDEIAAICFYRVDAKEPSYWSFSFTTDGRIAHLEPEE
jgi:CubicO group peptidase (beta-lactamase class C family)